MKFKMFRAWPGFLALLCLIAGSLLPFPGARVNASPAPDLTIGAIIWMPNTPSLGDQMSFTVTVLNQGNDTAGSSRLLFYIDNNIIDSAIIDQINPGGTIQHMFSWRAAAGDHVVKAVADSDQAVAESDETNNEKSYAFSVTAPDLIVSSITWTPEKPSYGSPVTFTVTVKNQGNKAANTNWVEFLIDGVSRGQREGQPLNPGATYTRNYSWVAQPGQHYLKASADVLNQCVESDETNNDLTVIYCTTPPDLTVDSLTWTPLNRGESDNVTMYTRVTNIGEGSAIGSWLSYYIDGSFVTKVFIDPLAPGASETKTYQWPPGSGEHIFTATIDADNTIFEKDESNNTRSVTLPALGLPDLTVVSLTCNPAVPGVNTRATFSIVIKNIGVRTVPKFLVALYTTGGVRVTRERGPLAPGETVTVDLDLMIGNIPLTVRAVADDDNSVVESNENNNELSIDVNPVKPLPTADLTIQSLTCTPSNPALGDTVTIKAVIKNIGSGPADESSAACFVDTDMLGYIYVRSLAPGQSVEATTTWKAVTGVHQVKFVADANNMIYEINENNNEATTTITTSDPDLTIPDIEWFPTYPDIGKDVMFTVTVANQGTRESGQCYLTYYINGSRQGEHYIEPLQPGASVTRIFTWNVQSASFTFKAVVDEANAVAESNENNNEKTVVIPAPNLTIKSITSSEDYPAADTVLSFTVDIANTGRSQAPPSLTSVYMDGESLAEAPLGALDAGQVAESVFYWTAVPGKHTLRVVTDSTNVVPESNENDNAQEIIVFVPLPSGTGNMNTTAPVQPENTVTTPVAAVQHTTTTTVPKPADLLTNKAKATTTTPDIAANITDTKPASSGGVKNILMNKLLMFGVAGLGIAAIVVLLILRRRSGGAKKEKTPKPPKAPKAPKPTKEQKPPKDQKKVEKKPAAPVKMGDTLSGKPAVLVPPPPKPPTKPGMPPIKTMPPPLPPQQKPAAPPPGPANPPQPQ